MKYLEKLACRFLIQRFRDGYGADCETYDLTDFPELGFSKERVISDSRCPSCRAEETIKFLKDHIDLIEIV